MAVKEWLIGDPWAHQGALDSFVFLKESRHPGALEARKPATVDRYDLDLVGSIAGATTVLLSVYQSGGLVLPVESPGWRCWLPEIRDRVPTPPSNTVAQQVADIQQIMGLSDQQVAGAFPGGISRETVNRWRNRPESNLRPENLYRLGLLHQLAKRMQEVGVDATVWLQQPTDQSGITPYKLISQGQLGLVRQSIERIAAGEDLADEPMIVSDFSREWDVSDEEDDDGDWIEAGTEEAAE
jgi:hypothetical protein